eukprot:gene20595-26704_t
MDIRRTDISAVAKHIGDLQHKATITGNERPLGVVITLFGKDDAEDVNSKPKIFSIKPSGQVIAWKAYSIGKSSGLNYHSSEGSYPFYLNAAFNTIKISANNDILKNTGTLVHGLNEDYEMT